MTDHGADIWGNGAACAPTVTIVFLVYNRREELRISLREMLAQSDYPAELVDVIVVDNASEDGAAEMVRAEFPQVQLIERDVNVGVSGWNDGFAAATGDYVLALDDDCYLPPDGLRRAVEAAQSHRADLVSFAVLASSKPDFLFTDAYRTGLLTFWGCAVLFRREVLRELGGYDPDIFVWANELEFTLRFFDRGYRHLHLPEVVAVHMKQLGNDWRDYVTERVYRVNAEHFAYIAAKLFHRRDAVEALVALFGTELREALRVHHHALKALGPTIKGFRRGLRNRRPVRNRELSRSYRRNFHSYAYPWWFSRPLPQLMRQAPRELLLSAAGRPVERPLGRHDEYFSERARYYPDSAATLEF